MFNNFRYPCWSADYLRAWLLVVYGGTVAVLCDFRDMCCPAYILLLVICHAKYLESVRSLSVKKDAFYFRANPYSEKFCFDNVPVGMNSSNKILPAKLCGEAGLTRKKFHSLRVTCATMLFVMRIRVTFSLLVM